MFFLCFVNVVKRGLLEHISFKNLQCADYTLFRTGTRDCQLDLYVQNVQNYKYDAFLMGKDSITWTERVLCSSIIDFIWFVLAVLLTWMDTVV